MAPNPQQNPNAKTMAFAANPARAIAEVHPGSSTEQAISGMGTVAQNIDSSEVFSTAYFRITRYCSPKAPPAAAASRIKRNPITTVPKVIGVPPPPYHSGSFHVKPKSRDYGLVYRLTMKRQMA